MSHLVSYQPPVLYSSGCPLLRICLPYSQRCVCPIWYTLQRFEFVFKVQSLVINFFCSEYRLPCIRNVVASSLFSIVLGSWQIFHTSKTCAWLSLTLVIHMSTALIGLIWLIKTLKHMLLHCGQKGGLWDYASVWLFTLRGSSRRWDTTERTLQSC